MIVREWRMMRWLGCLLMLGCVPRPQSETIVGTDEQACTAEAGEPELPMFATEAPEGVEHGLGLIEIVYRGEVNLTGLASGDLNEQARTLKKLIEYVDSIQDRPYSYGVLDDGHGAHLPNGTTFTRWALDDTGEYSGPITIAAVLETLQRRTGRPWTMYHWAVPPTGSPFIWVDCSGSDRDRRWATALAQSKELDLPIVMQICFGRELPRKPHRHLTHQERVDQLRWVAERLDDVECILHWTAEAGTLPQNAGAPRLDWSGVVEYIREIKAAMEVMQELRCERTEPHIDQDLKPRSEPSDSRSDEREAHSPDGTPGGQPPGR